MIKVLIPCLPTHDELVPYFRRIDGARWYTNRGPLVLELEKRLEELYGAHVATVANATLGLELAMKVQNTGPYFAPAYTFRASITALDRAGERIGFKDADRVTWGNSRDASIVEPPALRLCAYGFPVHANAHDVVDAAGAFGNLWSSAAPMVFSMHATKALPAGEGGFVVSKDERFIAEVRRLSNFGFPLGCDGTNAKMSEYHAAIGLKSLDQWLAREAALTWVRGQYQRLLKDVPVTMQPGLLVSMQMPVLLPEGVTALEVERRLRDEGIETRRWYESFCGLPVATMLRERVLGLPCHVFLEQSTIEYVCATLDFVIAELRSGRANEQR